MIAVARESVEKMTSPQTATTGVTSITDNCKSMIQIYSIDLSIDNQVEGKKK